MILLAIVFGVPVLLACVAAWFFRDEYDAAIPVIGVWLVAQLASGLAGSVLLDRQRFPAEAECRSRRMDTIVKPFSKDVVCIPYPTRQDTTTINANVKQ